MGLINLAMYVTLALSIFALILFGGLMILDRQRGEPVSATAPHVRGLQLAIGVIIISGAVSFATWLI